MRPRWTLRRNSLGRWALTQNRPFWRIYFSAWVNAVERMESSLSHWAIADLLDRAAAAPGEYEGVPALFIKGTGLGQKRCRIAEQARKRSMSVLIEVEEENDPRDTTFYVAARKEKGK